MVKRLIIITLILLPILLVIGCAGNATADTGVLEGKVSCIYRDDPQQPYPPEVYQTLKVMVYDADHSKLVKQVDIGSQGYYSVELPAGTYTIDINYMGTDHSDTVPRKLKVEGGARYMLDILN